MVAVAGIIMLGAARIAFQSDEITYFTADRGILLLSPNLWIADPWLTMVVNTALILATALLWMTVVQFFNPFRALTTLPASFFLIMMLSVPELTDQLTTGTVLAAVLTCCVPLLWSAFAEELRLRHIFLLFAILSFFTMTQYCFAVYIPAFFIGCIQMKLFSLRTIIACIVGICTPWWIALGVSLFVATDFHWPEISNIFSVINTESTVNLVFVSVTTSLLLIAGWLATFMNTITLNIKLRSFNGSLSILAVFTLLAIGIDYTNAIAYLPALMLLTSYQLAYFFGKANDVYRFIPIALIMLLYIVFYAIRFIF